MRNGRARVLVIVGGMGALAAGLLLPGLAGEVPLFLAACLLPGVAAAAWLLSAAQPWTRTIVGLALGPLVASVLAIGPFVWGASPRVLVVALGVAGTLGLALAPRPAKRAHSQGDGRLLDAPSSRRVAGVIAIAVVLCALPPLANEWGRVKGDGWIHAGIVYEIIERGVPPEDPRWAGQTLNYVWVYNFLIGILTGARGGDPFDFMVMLNLLDLAAFLGLVHLAAWSIWRERRAAAAAVVLALVGLNAGAWLLWPLRALRGLVGSERGPEAMLEALQAPNLLSWRVFYELSAPFSHMVNFIDKFTIGTAINQAWVQMMLVLWAVLAWIAGGPRSLLVLVAAGALGMLLFHGVIGLSVTPVLGLTLLLGFAFSRWRGMRGSLPSGRLVAAGISLVVGGMAALPYTRSVSRGWDPEQTGMTHSYFHVSEVMAWTVLTSSAIVFALAWAPARRLLRERHGPGILLVAFTVLMAAFAVFVNLPEENESKFAFQVFFPAVLLAAPALEPAFARARARFGRGPAIALALALFAVPPVLTLTGLIVELEGRVAPHANLSATERRFHAWLARNAPPEAVVVDAGFRDYAMVLARRQLYCGAPYGPSKAGFPAAEALERHDVMTDLYGPAADLEGDAGKLGRLGRPVYVIYREADYARPAHARVLDRAPALFRRVHDVDGFVVYSLLPDSTRGGVR